MILRQMKQRGIKPSKLALKLLQQKPIISYTIPTIEAIDMISTKKFPDVVVAGSYIYRIQRYPGDIDLTDTIIKVKKGKNDPIGELVKSIQDIIIRIKKKTLGKTNFFLGDIKIGVDRDYKQLIKSIGEIKSGRIVGYNYSGSIKELDRLKQKKLISSKHYVQIKELLKKKPSLLDFELLLEKFNNLIVYRWSGSQIVKGYVEFEDEKLTLREAIQSPGIIKIDMYYWLNNRFVEITSFLQLFIKKNGKLINVNIERKESEYIPDMKEQLHKYLSKFHFNPFKALKRMLVLSFIGKNDSDSRVLSKLMSSGYAIMYQVVGDLKVLLEITETINAPPYEKMGIEVNDMKDRLARIYEFDIPKKIYESINELYDDLSSGLTSEIEKTFKDLIMKLSNILNKNITLWIYKHKLIPLKSIYKN